MNLVRFVDATTGAGAWFELREDPGGPPYMVTNRACDVAVLDDAQRAGRVIQRILPGHDPWPCLVREITVTFADNEARVSLDAVRPVTRDPALAIAGTQGSVAGRRVPSGPGGVSGAR